MSGDGNRELGVEEIVEREDAEKLSLIIMRSVRGEADLFNPFQGRIFTHPDGTYKFLGRELPPEEVLPFMTDHLWKNRRKINKEIQKWKKAGPDLVNCGC